MRNPMNMTLLRFLITALAVAILAGCASSKAPSNTMFDFGPAAPGAAPRVAGAAPLPAVVVTDATGSAAFDSERMFYRLNYADAHEARSYANSRWNTNPLQMVTQRLKTRIAQSGTKVLSPSDASAGLPILRVDVDDFAHAFSSASQSEGQVTMRASLFQDHTLVDQKTFSRSTPAVSADAGGGARALADSTDAIASDIVAWMAGKDQRKR
jgi:cholesterol transport system auxiliary component